MRKVHARKKRNVVVEIAPSPSASVITDADRARLLERQGAALHARRQYAESEPLLREALRLRPESPELMNYLGSAIWEQGRPAEAEPLFTRAVELRPNNAIFVNNLGLAHWDQGRPARAAECYQRALELNPAANDVRMNLGVVLSDLGRFDEALEHLEEAVRIDPCSPDTLQNLGMTLGRTGRWPEAIAYYERALQFNPDYAEVHRNRAYGWLYMGDFERGWPEHEWRLRCRRHRGARIDGPRWMGEPLQGRSILLHAEQGLGDTLMFIRYAELVKELGATVFVGAQSRLLRIVARCPGVDMALDGSSIIPRCDFHSSLMSLPAIFRTTQATVPRRVPYLRTEPVVVGRWREAIRAAIGVDPIATRWVRGLPGADRIGRPLLVGVAWQGSPENPMDRFRSFPLAALAPVADIPGVQFVCVQAIDGLEQIPALEGRFRVLQLDGTRRREFTDTAALISLLDLIITPDSSIAHLAGGLGVPVWMAMSTVGEWRWMLHREDCPWYPSMRLFRQRRYGEWGPVFERMAAELQQALGMRPASAA